MELDKAGQTAEGKYEKELGETCSSSSSKLSDPDLMTSEVLTETKTSGGGRRLVFCQQGHGHGDEPTDVLGDIGWEVVGGGNVFPLHWSHS